MIEIILSILYWAFIIGLPFVVYLLLFVFFIHFMDEGFRLFPDFGLTKKNFRRWVKRFFLGWLNIAVAFIMIGSGIVFTGKFLKAFPIHKFLLDFFK